MNNNFVDDLMNLNYSMRKLGFKVKFYANIIGSQKIRRVLTLGKKGLTIKNHNHDEYNNGTKKIYLSWDKILTIQIVIERKTIETESTK